MPPFQLLHSLPSELLQEILTYLPPPALTNLNLASKWTYSAATPLLWKEVTLTDCTTHREDGERDFHDDTPLLRKLLILATNPWIAGFVQVVNHRCHLPPVGIFNELPKTPLSGQTLSSDPRTTELTRRAVAGMEKVHTLRIVFGHPNLNDALLRCFFSATRAKQTPIRRLWLEDSRLASGCDLRFPNHPAGLPAELDFTGLESLRFRRMPIRPAMSPEDALPRSEWVHSRGAQLSDLQDGKGGLYTTTIDGAWDEMGRVRVPDEAPADSSMLEPEMAGKRLLDVFSLPIKWDDWNFEDLDCMVGLPKGLPDVRQLDYGMRAGMASRGTRLDPADWTDLPELVQRQQRERLPSATVAMNMLRDASSTLTSLCFDWVLAIPQNMAVSTQRSQHYVSWLTTFADLFALRFPNLRAFQYRNAVTVDTIIPPGLYLLDHAKPTIRRADIKLTIPAALRKRLDLACLEFMEAHPNLQCLAWPMESFFPIQPTSSDISGRVQSVVNNLARTLVDLRVDTVYSPHGESQSENINCHDPGERGQRRRFIADFASEMMKVESIKVEGGIPRDERRELIRALHQCALNKIVLIGVCSPIGNTWGPRAVDIMPVAQSLDADEVWNLEAEHKDAIHRLGHTKPEPPSSAFHFEPIYGWPASPPMIHTIASFHRDTITELKFCGYKGAPVLFDPTPVTCPMLAALKHFDKLETLIMSFCLVTTFEGASRDREIIKYWLDSRSPSTTSLVRVTSDEDDMGVWERELHTKYAPRALAGEVVRQIGPLLSEHAKGRKNGVHVRASMCLGEWGGIFDIDCDVGKDGVGRDVCLGFEGPREELEERRRRDKLVSRRWF